MKKILYIILPAIIILGLVACGKKEQNLVISKLYTASNSDNNTIELYNNTDKDIDLKSFSIDIYNNGEATIQNDYALSGVIKANSFYAIAGPDVEDEIKGKIDLVLDDRLSFNGDDAIALSNKGKIVDVIGTIGVDLTFSANLTLIKLGNKEDFKATKTYDSYDYIAYIPDLFKYLKNDDYEIKTFEDLLKGPRLEQRYKEMDYAKEGATGTVNIGTGGATKVTLRSVADGDTATFQPVVNTPGYSNGNSVRYYYINTPEVDGSNVNAEPWGYVASKLNKEFILNQHSSKELYVQSFPNTQTTETYGRNLGLVWINNQLSQFLTVAEGLSERMPDKYTENDILLTYKEVPYLTFLRFAERNAVLKGWGLYGYPNKPDGEKSPDWDYVANKLLTTKPVWEPHNTIIFE